VSQWPVSPTSTSPEVQISAGVYDANPNYLTTSDAGIYAAPGIPRLKPRLGVLCRLSDLGPGGHLYRTWRLGGWYDSASTIDGGLPGIITTIPGVGGVPGQIWEIKEAATAFYESICSG